MGQAEYTEIQNPTGGKLGPPPALPTTPKPKVAITKLTLEDSRSGLPKTPVSSQDKRCRQRAFRYSKEFHKEYITDRRIKRRHSYQGIKVNELGFSSGASPKCTEKEHKHLPAKCHSFSVMYKNSPTRMSSPINEFDRNTPCRRAVSRKLIHSTTLNDVTNFCDRPERFTSDHLTFAKDAMSDGNSFLAEFKSTNYDDNFTDHSCFRLPNFIQKLFT